MERKLGNYTIQGEIGRGGMAVVYKAVQKSLDRLVAIKELDLSRLRADSKALDRFRLEAKAVAALEHPNIVTVYDLWEEEDKAYIAMEFVDGVELKDVLLNLGPIEYLNAVTIILAISGALHYAHLKGMVHRDVKPGNIMLSGKGDVRLMDFGIVSVAGDEDLTVAGQILGTPAYMPPEQVAGEKLGPGTDIFSLGAVLYEMIAGKKPFAGNNHVALIQAVLHDHPVPLHEMLDREVPESISLAVQKCLEKSAEQRYGSMEEFSTVLEMVMPLDQPDLKTIVKGLVGRSREQERTRLQTSAGTDDRTSPQVAAEQAPEEAAVRTRPSKGHDSRIEERRVQGESLLREPGAYVHDLENGPSAELPPLEPEAADDGGFEVEPLPKTPPRPLTLKDIPEPVPAEGTEYYDEEKSVPGPKPHFLWILPVLLLIVAVGVWRFTGGSKPADLLEKAIVPLTDANARVTVVADPSASVFMDGQPMGDAGPSLVFEVEPGLHRLEIRNPEYDPRKIIVELEPGQEKEIIVKFSEQ